MNKNAQREILSRIEAALDEAARAISPYLLRPPRVEYKSGRDPVTDADRTVNRVLHDALLQDHEGWLSEESGDDFSRLGKDAVWVVDPIDGTREFIAGIPEWCISIGYVEKGRAVAGGICNPAAREVFLGALGEGVKLNGAGVSVRRSRELANATVLASRSEIARGEWNGCRDAPFATRPMGSVAYKLALVAAGAADATWTRRPKNEWDIAAGAALVSAAGGLVRNLDGSEVRFNNRSPMLPGLFACSASLAAPLDWWLRERGEK